MKQEKNCQRSNVIDEEFYRRVRIISKLIEIISRIFEIRKMKSLKKSYEKIYRQVMNNWRKRQSFAEILWRANEIGAWSSRFWSSDFFTGYRKRAKVWFPYPSVQTYDGNSEYRWFLNDIFRFFWSWDQDDSRNRILYCTNLMMMSWRWSQSKYWKKFDYENVAEFILKVILM